MANDVAIRVGGLGKCYRLGGRSASYRTLRETIMGLGRARGRRGSREETIWALKGVDLEVGRGDVLGVIGRNGAGKTTMLKILSRITEPTTGRVELYGRVGSLLEVGTGFHPELTGRENIYLNGAILGMKKAEITRKFDEIVAFAEMERFLDTPVKHYSSGMYMRLAFAVAAHLEPDILLVDEVLAVGDAGFQKKCLGKMGDVAGEGRTVVFVSHNMQAIRNLCSRVILLEEGGLISDEEPLATVDRYNDLLRTQQVGADTALHEPKHRRGSGRVRFTSIEIVDEDRNPTFHFKTGETVRFQLSTIVNQPVPELLVGVALRSSLSGEILTSVKYPISRDRLAAGVTPVVTIEWPDIPIRPGHYPLYFWLGNSAAQPFDVVDDLTAPLTVSLSSTDECPHFEKESPVGFVSIQSRFVRER